MDNFDVRLAQVMTGGLNNWGLRSLANGRHTMWESFKSKQEAITAGTSIRSLRGDNSAQGSSADLNATLLYMTKNMFPGQDPYLWDNRYNAIKELTKELAKVVVRKGPVAANQSMLQQIQELQRENARLKSARAGAPSPAASTAPRTPVHTPPPKNNWPPKSTVTPKAAATPKSSGAHPTPPSYRRPKGAKDRHSTTEAPDNTIIGASRTVGIRDVRKRLVQTRNKNPLRKKPKMMMPRLFPALTFHRQVCQTRI